MRDLYTRNSDRGRGGSKIPKIRLTSFVHGPLVCICLLESESRGIKKPMTQTHILLEIAVIHQLQLKYNVPWGYLNLCEVYRRGFEKKGG